MRDMPTDRQARVLRLVSEAGGYVPVVDDCRAADECIDREWLMPESRSGYAITIDGSAAMRVALCGSERVN
jgi:hypothetical protein